MNMKKLILIMFISANSVYAESKINNTDMQKLFTKKDTSIVILSKEELLDTKGESWFIPFDIYTRFWQYTLPIRIEEPSIHWNSPWIR